MQNKRLIFAHRGLVGDEFPENSPGAFRNTINAGMGIELDLRLTKDGVPVVFHDKTLRRMCGDVRKISAIDYAELSRFRLNGTDEKIPSFEEVLRLVNSAVPLLIELKLPKRHMWHRRLERKLLPILENYKGEYMLQSFNKHSMKYMKRKLPKIKCGILSGDCYSEPSGFDFINYRLSCLTEAKAAALRKKYALVFGWISGNMTSEEAGAKMNALGLDGAVI